jgi:hypothetical protein
MAKLLIPFLVILLGANILTATGVALIAFRTQKVIVQDGVISIYSNRGLRIDDREPIKVKVENDVKIFSTMFSPISVRVER